MVALCPQDEKGRQKDTVLVTGPGAQGGEFFSQESEFSTAPACSNEVPLSACAGILAVNETSRFLIFLPGSYLIGSCQCDDLLARMQLVWEVHPPQQILEVRIGAHLG